MKIEIKSNSSAVKTYSYEEIKSSLPGALFKAINRDDCRYLKLSNGGILYIANSGHHYVGIAIGHDNHKFIQVHDVITITPN